MHFFIHTDNNNITTQALADGYGPESIDPTNKYTITSRFQLIATTKAFACQDSVMIVQQSSVNADLVNVILKPIEGLKIPFNSVNYYVYRGLKKDSFITGTGVKPSGDADKSEFIDRFWKDWKSFKINSNQPNIADPTPQSFGYDTTLAGTLDIEKIYDNSQPDVQGLFVKEGEWIGDFACVDSYGNPVKIGFEVIIETDGFVLDVNYLKAEKYQIDVTGLSDFVLRAKREQILSFIDPSAFFGLHYEIGVNITVYNGNNKNVQTKKKDDLYKIILDKFATKNRVYLDIRSEKGYSYNFYQNYNGSGNNIKIGNSVTTPTEQIYESNGWPIVFINVPLTTTQTANDIKINLRIDDNVKPLLFVENVSLLGVKNKSRFFSEKGLLNGNSIDWSNTISIFFPNTGTGSSKDNVSYYVKLIYYKQTITGIFWDGLSETDKTQLQLVYTRLTTNSTLFNGIINSLINKSKKLYIIFINPLQTVPGLFTSYVWGGTISFPNNTPSDFAFVEEFFHAYQSVVATNAYEQNKTVNREFEAKVFDLIVMHQAVLGYGVFPDFTAMDNYLLSNYTDGVPSLSDIQSQSFVNFYLTAADNFRNFWINQNVGTSYKVKNEQAPHAIEKAYTE